MKVIRATSLACACVLMFVGKSHAATVSYLASGTGTFSSQSGTVPSAVSNFLAASGLDGGNVLARFSIDTSVGDSNIASDAATYREAVISSSLTFGSLTHTATNFCSPAFPDCSILVDDNVQIVPTVFGDSYSLRSRNMNIDQNDTGFGINVSFLLSAGSFVIGSNPSLLSSTDIDPGLDGLPGLGLSIRFLGFGQADGYDVTYTVEGLSIARDLAAPVPEPDAYALILAGLGLIGAVARQRNARQ